MLKVGQVWKYKSNPTFPVKFRVTMRDGYAELLDDACGDYLAGDAKELEQWLLANGLYCVDEDKTDPGIKPAKARPVKHQPPVPCPKCKGTNTLALWTTVECRDCDGNAAAQEATAQSMGWCG